MTTAAKRCYDLLSEGLTQAGVNPSKRSRRTRIQNAEASQTLEQFESLGKIVPRLISPFIEVRLILTLGYQLSQQVTPTDPVATGGAPLPQEALEENERFRSAYKKLIAHMPGFSDLIEEFRKTNWDSKWSDIVSLISKTATQTRSNDSSSICNKLNYFLVDAKATVPQELLDEKSTRGFNHSWTGRLLCPRRMLTKFRQDPDAFIAKCNPGPRKILHSDWPTFLYVNDDQEYDRANPEEGLFRGIVLIRILRHLLIGPGAALRPEQKQTRRSNARIIGASTINAHLIAYAACLARFMLNNSKEWDHTDFQFDASAFYDRIINYFDSGKDDDSVIELLAWFQREVFTGRSPTATNEENIPDSEDEAEDEDEDARIAQQRELRRNQRNANNGNST